MPAFRIPDATRDFVELPERGVVLAVLDFGGDGPLAILSHANGFCASLYAPAAERLRTRYRVIAFDSRGHGKSTVLRDPAAYEWEEFALDWQALAAAVCDRVGAPRVELGVGHSFGGSALLKAATRAPASFGAIALIDPVISDPDGAPGLLPGQESNALAAGAARRTAAFPSRDVVRSSWARRGVFSAWEPEVLELYLRDGFRDLPDGGVELRCPPAVEAAIFDAAPRFDLFASIPGLKVPTLWLHAALGNFPPERIERARRLSACIEVDSLARTHLMLMESPREIADRILAWATAERARAPRSAP